MHFWLRLAGSISFENGRPVLCGISSDLQLQVYYSAYRPNSYYNAGIFWDSQSRIGKQSTVVYLRKMSVIHDHNAVIVYSFHYQMLRLSAL